AEFRLGLGFLADVEANLGEGRLSGETVGAGLAVAAGGMLLGGQTNPYPLGPGGGGAGLPLPGRFCLRRPHRTTGTVRLSDRAWPRARTLRLPGSRIAGRRRFARAYSRSSPAEPNLPAAEDRWSGAAPRQPDPARPVDNDPGSS